MAAAPASLDIRHKLAVALAKQGHLEEAIVHFRHVADAKPEWADVWGNLGLALVQARKSEEAVGAYRQLVKFRRELESHPPLKLERYLHSSPAPAKPSS